MVITYTPQGFRSPPSGYPIHLHLFHFFLWLLLATPLLQGMLYAQDSK